ncbi:uncharacterized protein SEPMUDRAFT_68410 [Sphaerulina musiva SO2202]|uniref:Non-structural maintenance of chromosomes element 1 homolog n=1 Tax=Sphaerulina musiva (strain SO2202) TaxID=692275 RepID=M3AWI4_SPHMS|nr:uncharacterized protein SEPMUDRAFT_68410 [Sphaerulina musiva SO2202]EMF11110.1 hypothetical protein SEPMUDRAFT_68410 [Sphaerulina musiva SO2202]
MSHDAEDDEATYGNNHRAFLQALLARQTLTFEQAKPLISSIRTAAAAAAAASASTPTHAPSTSTTNRVHLPSDITPEDFLLNYIHPLNSLLSLFDLEIRRSFHQLTREEIFALVNTTSDAMTQMATAHSPDEIAYVKRLLDAMFEGNNTVEKEIMAVHAVQARALARVNTQFSWNHQNNSSSSNNSSLTQSQAEKVLEAMELEGWFEKSTVVMGGGSSSRNERRKVIWYTLTPRALMELQQWLVDTYNHEEEEEENENEAEENEETHQKIKFCKACRQIVTMGQRCPKMTCNVRLHHDCVGKMFRAQRDHETCPTCKTEWQDAPLVGIEAVKEPVAAAAAGRRKSRNGTAAARNGGRRRSAASTVNGYDEEEEGEGEEEGDGEVDGELP